MLPPECETALQQLDDFRRGELDNDAMELMRMHLESCVRCLNHNRHESALLDRLLAATRNSSCPDDLRTAIYQMIAKESSDN